MGEILIKQGSGWRIGWNPTASKYQGLVGTDEWSLELTEVEFNDFCRLLTQLSQTMATMAQELMDEERITCEAESESLWIEVEGYPHSYEVRFILNTGRRGEGYWSASVVPALIAAIQTIKVF